MHFEGDEKMTEPIYQCCGNCQYWDRPSVTDRSGNIGHTSVAKCMWVVQIFPVSVAPGLRGGIYLSFMAQSKGTDCACWVAAGRGESP